MLSTPQAPATAHSDGVRTNLSPEIVQAHLRAMAFVVGKNTYGSTLGQKIRIKELWLQDSEEDVRVKRARALCEVDVDETMLNQDTTLSEQTITYILDM